MAWREDKCQLLINCFLCTCIWLGHDRDRAAGLALWDSRVRADRAGAGLKVWVSRAQISVRVRSLV